MNLDALAGVVLLDVSMFANHPTRTGIQRMLKAFCDSAISNAVVPFIVVDRDSIGLLDIQFLSDCQEYFSSEEDWVCDMRREYHPGSEELGYWYVRLRSSRENAVVVEAEEAFRLAAGVLHWDYNFYDLNLDFYFKRLVRFSEKIVMVAIDFLYWTHHEEFYASGSESHQHTKYLMLLRRSRRVCFISEYTRAQFFARIAPGWLGDSVVVHPGADALGSANGVIIDGGYKFVVVGTIEPRKQSPGILSVFEELVRSGHDVSLQFLGGLSPLLSPTDAVRFNLVRDSDGPICWTPSPSDTVIRSAIRSARCVIALSSGEGFGATVMEALALGVPSISSGNTPSVKEVTAKGQVNIDYSDVHALTNAVLMFCDDIFVVEKRREIDGVQLPSWKGFARTLLEWVAAGASCGPETFAGRCVAELFGSRVPLSFSPTSLIKRGEISAREFVSEIRNGVRSFNQDRSALPFDVFDASSEIARQFRRRRAAEVSVVEGVLFRAAELVARRRWHEEIIELRPEDFVDRLSLRYLERTLSALERSGHAEDVRARRRPISKIIEFADCGEAKALRGGLVEKEWNRFLQSWSEYEFILALDRYDDPVRLVREVYTRLLGREPSPTENEEYASVVAQHSSGLIAAQSVLLSAEHIRRVRSVDAYVWALRWTAAVYGRGIKERERTNERV